MKMAADSFLPPFNQNSKVSHRSVFYKEVTEEFFIISFFFFSFFWDKLSLSFVEIIVNITEIVT